MRLVSNKESVARGEVSILAIVETLLAIALVFYLSAHFNTLRWLAIAMCVSPLLLLRTETSTRLGIEWLDRIISLSEFFLRSAAFFDLLMRRSSDRRRPFLTVRYCLQMIVWAAIYGVVVPSASLTVRIAATIRACLQRPAEALAAIPRNWSIVSLAIDSRFAPEVVPDHPTITIQAAFEAGKERRDSQHLFLLSIFPCFGIAFIYRFSVKATSIIYAPLVFVAHSTFNESADLRTNLELIKRGDLSRIRVWYGVIAIAAFLVKLLLMMNLPGFADWWNGHPVSQFLALYVAPAEIPKWQLAELANLVLAIGAMLFARRALLGYELQHPWPEVLVKRLLGFVSGLRWVLALYTILCTGYITMRAAQHWNWPAFGEKWLPW